MLIVGLGNPGAGYARNRHNVGAMVLDELARRMDGKFAKHKSGCDLLEGRLGGEWVALAKPRALMNVSGGPVAGTARFFRITPADLIVVHDELDLDFGEVRTKFGGGEGGHNGLRSITKSLGSRDYHRVRVGVGRPPGRMDPASYVLTNFSAPQRKDLPFLLDRAADATEAAITPLTEP